MVVVGSVGRKRDSCRVVGLGYCVLLRGDNITLFLLRYNRLHVCGDFLVETLYSDNTSFLPLAQRLVLGTGVPKWLNGFVYTIGALGLVPTTSNSI